tara:strand:- start:1379 stop:2413 length:1035 start_codon:yes stop_codon:yes gene_type:complete
LNVNKEFYDSLIFRSIDLQKFSGSFTKKIQQEFKALEHSVLSSLLKLSLDLNTPKTLRTIAENRLKQELNETIYSHFNLLERVFTKDMSLIGIQENEFLHKKLKNISDDAKSTLLPSTILKGVRGTPIARKSFHYWMDSIRSNFRRNLLNRINGGLSSGERIEDVIKTIRGDRKNGFRNGVFTPTARKTETLFRSGVNSVTNEIRHSVFINNAHLIKSLHWNSTLDGNSSSICSHSHNSSWDVPSLAPQGESQTYQYGSPHFNCRSTIIPIFHDHVTTQEAFPKPIMDWIGERTEDEHKSIFGQKKYSLYQNKKISYPQLTNFKSTPISLEGMQRRYEYKWNSV